MACKCRIVRSNFFYGHLDSKELVHQEDNDDDHAGSKSQAQEETMMLIHQPEFRIE